MLVKRLRTYNIYIAISITYNNLLDKF